MTAAALYAHWLIPWAWWRGVAHAPRVMRMSSSENSSGGDSWSKSQERGDLSGRQRRNRDAWRNRPLWRWSKDTSHTSSGLTDVHALSAERCHRLGPPGVRP